MSTLGALGANFLRAKRIAIEVIQIIKVARSVSEIMFQNIW